MSREFIARRGVVRHDQIMRNSQSIVIARRLRRNANAPEAIAWEILRRLRRNGIVVRRQHPIGRFVVDFAIVTAKLVIEVDGGVHRRPDILLRDASRAAEIEQRGWRIVRVSPEVAMSADHLTALVQRQLGV